ncbi:MAG: ImmA/IrrE family metallo-endopeptidase [Candidatus Abawacabacteria bacterium]|nr:ImmA/IrrE family metallo-endopeptidase [Candidatus Abawacabacteria bacterium]
MEKSFVVQKAEEIQRLFNPSFFSPFPYQNILDKFSDLKIFLIDLDQGVSGVIRYEENLKEFHIFVDQKKSETRQHFTIAHELGHYFLHQDIIKKENLIVDGDNIFDTGGMLFRLDGVPGTQFEMEANEFAATLIMPESLVREAWEKLKSVDDCASIFHVSPLAMSIRLEKLALLS